MTGGTFRRIKAPRYIVQAGEGTAYCALCELEAVRRELAALTARAEAAEDEAENLSSQLFFLPDYYDTNDSEAATERVMLMRRDNQRAAAARRPRRKPICPCWRAMPRSSKTRPATTRSRHSR